MKQALVLIGPVVGGGLAWLLSGNWRLGVTLFAALLAGGIVQRRMRRRMAR